MTRENDTRFGRETMRKTTLSATFLATTMLAQPGFADEHLRIVEEPLELSIHFHWPRNQGYEEDYPVEQAAREMTGIHLVDATAGRNTPDHNEAMNLLLAQGDLPDIVGGNRIKDPVNQYGPQGAFLPLDELIEEHAPNIKALLDERPELRDAMASSDGKIYYVPYLPDGKFGRAWYIRQDWLDALGLERPDNVEELYQVLVAFRDQDPNGNGKKDEIPIFERQWEELIRFVTLWDGRSSGSDTYHDFYVDNGEVKHPYATEGYREGMKNLAKWYAEGLIDPEIFTRGSSAREYLLSENLGGLTHDWFASTSGYNAALAEKVPGFNFAPMLPPESVSGQRIEEHRRTPLKPDGWAISYANEHPVETIKYFDFWFTEEGRRLSNFGVEGVHYEMVDGEPVYTEEVLTSDQPVNSQMWEIGAQIPRGFYMDYAYEWQWTSDDAREGIELYEQNDLLIDQFLGVSFNEEEQAVYDKYWPSILTYMLERQQAWILGTGDVEADWGEYMAQLDKRGLSDVLEVMNSAYERQYES
ncbi:carbohydrate ABC transporter substrate-binding protein (CUT1 family) [Limimaricola soesokkakensis]|uniref:Carbohydrate ABC transporter substrate-binding protein (CUT1 family) n=2 Tax=Limimaricola soesokkakensis TaxID=1343159 RepID=A0A1X6ZD48_9RHOB|nr:carbohydrate ABC transporter substrate-binding protein (CUT1 family) [Limimaricola soesokkakensis]SLN47566.1 Lipoprotein LipO precursor [Limimaricola soesokkakensis]